MAILTMLNQVTILFVLMGLGFVLARRRVLDEHVCQQLTWLLCYIVMPCLILRITSYNVCYTKLLRQLQAPGAVDQERERLRVAHSRDRHRITPIRLASTSSATEITCDAAWKARWYLSRLAGSSFRFTPETDARWFSSC